MLLKKKEREREKETKKKCQKGQLEILELFTVEHILQSEISFVTNPTE